MLGALWLFYCLGRTVIERKNGGMGLSNVSILFIVGVLVAEEAVAAAAAIVVAAAVVAAAVVLLVSLPVLALYYPQFIGILSLLLPDECGQYLTIPNRMNRP